MNALVYVENDIDQGFHFDVGTGNSDLSAQNVSTKCQHKMSAQNVSTNCQHKMKKEKHYICTRVFFFQNYGKI